MVTISLLSLSMMSRGTLAGASMPCRDVTSHPGISWNILAGAGNHFSVSDSVGSGVASMGAGGSLRG